MDTAIKLNHIQFDIYLYSIYRGNMDTVQEMNYYIFSV